MKTRICLLITFALFSYYVSNSKEAATGQNPLGENSINVFTTPDLYNLTMKWVSEYSNLNPKVKINVIKAGDKNVPGMLHPGEGLAFTGDETLAERNNQSIWNMVVGRDIIVPVMNAKNPLRNEIIRKGVTSKALTQILESPEKRNWGMLTDNAQNIQNISLNYYIPNYPSVLSGVNNFLNINALNCEGFKTGSGEAMISAIQKDPNALGFCKLIQIMDINHQSLVENIELVPIDKNGNGKIDYMENIYDNLQAFSRGVWIGKYPKALSGKIYAVSSEKPKSETELAFLNWILTDGQRYLNANGYDELVLNERQSQLSKIEPIIYTTIPVNETPALLKILLLALLAFGVIIVFWNLLSRRDRIKKGAVLNAHKGTQSIFDENSVIIPKGIYFDKTHTWAFMKKDGTVKIGIDDFLQHITGSITRIEMKNSGEKIKKGECLFTIVQKGKQLDIYSPVSGTIKTRNRSLLTDSSLLNSAPYEDGWIYTIEPTNWLLEIQFLSMSEKYKIGLKHEFIRLKDFFASVFKSDAPEFALITLQDGGALKDNIMADLGPEIWDDFQTKFLDVTK